MSDTQKTWDECNLYCQELGAHLVKIETATENQFIFSTTTANLLYWTGARDVVTGKANKMSNYVS